MPNRLDTGIRLVLTQYEAMALLRAINEAEVLQAQENDQEISLPRKEADISRAWDRIRKQVYAELSDSAEHGI